MTLTLDERIGQLPPYIGREIFTFIIPETNAVEFRKTHTKYDYAYIGDKYVQNKKRTYLCRIEKKNGKHRYYLTDEYETSECDGCGSPKCRNDWCGIMRFERFYASRYVGKDIHDALILLFANT